MLVLVRPRQTDPTYFSNDRRLAAASTKTQAGCANSYYTAHIRHYRDGDVVLYRRPRSLVWQCRYRLLAGRWIRVSTWQRNLEDEARRACELYDEAPFRERLGLSATTCNFREAATATLGDLREALAAGIGRRVFEDYCSAIERYFIPFFGNRMLERIDHRTIAEFERWRNRAWMDD